MVFLVFAAVSVLVRVTWKKHLRGFLGAKRGRRATIKILLSSIYIKESGSLSLNSIRRGFFGYAHTEAEYNYALRLAAALRTRTLGRFVQALGDRIYDSPIDQAITAQVTGSPGYVTQAPDGEPVVASPDNEIREILSKDQTVILVGSPLYNSAVNYVLSHAGRNSHFNFYRPDPGPDKIGYAISARPYGTAGGTESFLRAKVRDPSSQHDGKFRELFLIQKVADPSLWNARIFVCAGTSTAATTAALEALADWRSLYKEFGTRAFAVLFELHTRDREVTISDEAGRPEGWSVSRLWTHTTD